MQKVTVLCVGKLKEAFYAAAVAEYQKRLQRHCKLEIVELPEQKLPESPAPAEIEQALAREAALIEEKLPKGGAVIALCIEGTELSSEALSKKLAQLASAGASQLAFLIGGSRIAHYLSKMLLSMGVRVTLVESNEAHCRRLSESLPEALILHGDGTDQELLLSEHFTNNDAFIALTGRDEDNLISALYAQQQGLRKVVAKCNRVNYSSVVQAAGLDCVVAPKLITVARILRLVRGFEDKSGSVMTALYRISDTDVEAAEFILHENTPHLGIPLKDLEIRKGFLIVALLHENQVVVPSGGTVLSPGDRVIVISHGQGIQTFRDIFLKP